MKFYVTYRTISDEIAEIEADDADEAIDIAFAEEGYHHDPNHSVVVSEDVVYIEDEDGEKVYED